MKCKKCLYEWNPKKPNPKECPHCKSRDYRNDNFCFICENELSPDGEVHHIDGNKNNNETFNLISLCIKCHQTIHKPSRIKKFMFAQKQIELLKYYTNILFKTKKQPKEK